METQHKNLLAAVLLIGFLLHLVPVPISATASTVPLPNEPVISVYTDAAAVQDLSIQGSRGNWEVKNEGRSSDDERGRKVVIGRKLLQVEIDDYSPPGPNPTHDPVSPLPPL